MGVFFSHKIICIYGTFGLFSKIDYLNQISFFQCKIIQNYSRRKIKKEKIENFGFVIHGGLKKKKKRKLIVEINRSSFVLICMTHEERMPLHKNFNLSEE